MEGQIVDINNIINIKFLYKTSEKNIYSIGTGFCNCRSNFACIKGIPFTSWDGENESSCYRALNPKNHNIIIIDKDFLSDCIFFDCFKIFKNFKNEVIFNCVKISEDNGRYFINFDKETATNKIKEINETILNQKKTFIEKVLNYHSDIEKMRKEYEHFNENITSLKYLLDNYTKVLEN